MDLPTSRELDLETELRKRDAQVAELTDEVTRLREHLAAQGGASTTDSVTLPPALVSVLLPHINKAASSEGTGVASSSSTVNTALTQRVRILQEENDELYEMLKSGETGQLKEEVRGLRRVVERLEGALRESHQVIASLSSELDKSYESFQTSVRQMNANHHSYAPAPRELYHPASTSNGVIKLPPTGPRAHKKPRLSEPKVSPARSNISLPPTKPHIGNARQSIPRDYEAVRSPRLSPTEPRIKVSNVKMEVDEDARTRPRSPNDNRDRETHRRDKDRARDHEGEHGRDRDRDRFARRNGGGSGGGGGRRARGFASHAYAFGDRTLAERMGL
ncbi:uncharacterized protein F5147DRAFT_675867 [Suillus discolor]|uniref:Uncharacterized protein n=1 Tax=Suillus discolor TaxID=1912936 RepID=A0A9P7FGS2_9AGAM|nr:uncharacterized protein F5147DRAFT_675867 [Suillus discolor]KAG2116071.1 hypothetical protein F5147DRAFT_675867 [Suillus discolor]